MKTRILALIAALCITATAAQAGTATGTATVTINYAGACSITAASPTLEFAATDASAPANVTVNCSNGLAWVLTADGGSNAQGEVRRGKKNTEYLTYRIFKDAGLTQEVGVTSNTVATGTGTGVNQIQTPYYALKTADNAGTPTVGAYADSVGYTLTF